MSKKTIQQFSEKLTESDLFDGLGEWVSHETPSGHPKEMNALVDLVEKQFLELGAVTERIADPDKKHGDILLCHAPWNKEGQPRLLISGHLDTVHPLGILEKLPYGPRDGGDPNVIYGPGTADMKAGIFSAYYAFKMMVESKKESPMALTFMFIPDEEVSSPFSAPYTIEWAKKSHYALVGEMARPDGEFVTCRKGVGSFRFTVTARDEARVEAPYKHQMRMTLSVEGKDQHAGTHHHEGESAIEELARQILSLKSYQTNKTAVHIREIHGGSTRNTVPRNAKAVFILSGKTEKDLDGLRQDMEGITPHNKKCTLKTNLLPAKGDYADIYTTPVAMEAAHQIVTLESMTDYDEGITVNVGTLKTVKNSCFMDVDLRAEDREKGAFAELDILNMDAQNKRTRLDITGRMVRPPMPETKKNLELFAQVQDIISDAMGERVKPLGYMTGGGSDANLCAAAGIGVIDGLGPMGADDHTLRERFYLDSLKTCVLRFVAIFMALDAKDTEGTESSQNSKMTEPA